MLAKEKTFLEKEREECEGFAEILKRIPEHKKKEAKAMLDGFALCAEMEEKKVG